MKLFNFRGGIHPVEHKHPTADLAIRSLPLPQRLYIPVQQHSGAPALPIVKVGEKVLKGQRIGKAQGAVSAAIHAPSSGTIVGIGDFTAAHVSGLPVCTIILELDGEDREQDHGALPDPFTLSPEDIARRVGEAGIVGMGGANFPAGHKLASAFKAKVHTLVLNGAECEPYMTCDDRLMRERAAGIVDGGRLMQRAIGAQRILIAIEDNKPEAILAMQTACAAYPDVEVVVTPTRYPTGSAKQLTQLLTGQEVPAGGRGTATGVLVNNVGTAYAVHQALRHGQPLISRIVTVAGSAVTQPGNVEVRLGTLAAEVLGHCGTDMNQVNRLLMGGPMMGQPLPHTQIPVVKGMNGLLALTHADVPTKLATSPCIRCGRCVEACPMGLLPLEMARHARHQDFAGTQELGLDECIACGSCAYVCPSHIPLVQYFEYAKGELADRKQMERRNERIKQWAEQRTKRLERQARAKAEEAARRKAAKAATAKSKVVTTVEDDDEDDE